VQGQGLRTSRCRKRSSLTCCASETDVQGQGLRISPCRKRFSLTCYAPDTNLDTVPWELSCVSLHHHISLWFYSLVKKFLCVTASSYDRMFHTVSLHHHMVWRFIDHHLVLYFIQSRGSVIIHSYVSYSPVDVVRSFFASLYSPVFHHRIIT